MVGDLGGQLDVALRLLLAAVLGALIGSERELRGHAAGMRTHLLVCVGSALFTALSLYGFVTLGSLAGAADVRTQLDPSRVAAQIVSGIGFLGAGAIVKYGTSIRGLTTAASLWATAAVGMAAGAGIWLIAVVTTAIVLISLAPLRWVSKALRGGRHEAAGRARSRASRPLRRGHARAGEAATSRSSTSRAAGSGVAGTRCTSRWPCRHG